MNHSSHHFFSHPSGDSCDMTEGPIVSHIVRFAFPILLGLIFQNLYNSVDSIIVGNFVGTTSLAAVSASSNIAQLIIGFFAGLSSGSSILFSRFFGARDYRNLRISIHTTLSISAILGAGFALLGILLTPWLLQLVNCPDDVMPEARLYLRVYLIGVLFTSIYNVASGVLRAIGDSRRPFYYLLIASCTNIVLDYLLVVVIPLGVIGAAVATILAQLLSVFLVLRKLVKGEEFCRLNFQELKIDFDMSKKVIHLGLPAALQSCIIAFSNLFIQRYSNSFGAAAIAGLGVANKIDRFAFMFSQSLGLSVATFVGQNTGARRYDRAFAGVRMALLTGLAANIAFIIPVCTFAPAVVRIFTSDPDAIYYGVLMVQIVMPLYVLQVLNQTYGNAVRGFGNSITAMVSYLAGMVLLRQIYLNIVFRIYPDVRVIIWGYPFGWGCTALLSIVCYYYLKHRIRKSIGDAPDSQ